MLLVLLPPLLSGTVSRPALGGGTAYEHNQGHGRAHEESRKRIDQRDGARPRALAPESELHELL